MQIIAPRCQVTSFPINFSNIQYGTQFESSPLCFGSVTNYKYLLPLGWLLNGATSNGTTWIAGNNSVTITSDLTHGDGGNIAIRAVNPCAANLTKGTIVYIAISRPTPILTITNGANNLCVGVSSQYTINGVPAGANIKWSIDNTNLAQITGTNNTSTVTVQANSIGYTGDITITATVTDCMSTYTKPILVTIGTGSAPTITNLNADNTCGSFAEAYCTNPPNSTGFIWTYNFGQVVQNNPGYYGDYFLLRPLGQTVIGQTYYDYLSVQATNACGVSASSATLQFTVGPISATCGTGGGKGLLDINPSTSTNSIKLSDAETTNKTINGIAVYPNPVNNILKLEVKTKLIGSWAKIADANGKILYQSKIANIITNIDVAKFTSGIYYLQVILPNFTTKIIKFLKL